MSATHLALREDDVVRLTLEFLHNRELHISQLSLERETGVINGNYADDVLFLRQLILDGQWDDVLEFIQPLSTLKNFEGNKFNYAILRHKYIELLCIRSEIKAYNNAENVVDEVVKVLADLEKLAPTKDEYSNLCLLLTLPSITDHAQFKEWNPSNARVQCFREVYPLVEQFLPSDKKSSGNCALKFAKNDRLMQLVIKGILYESCVNYCQSKATGSPEISTNKFDFSSLLDGSGFDESDLSLLSWLQSVPTEVFNVPFEQRMLNVNVERLERPSLHTSWTEHMLITPIKPRAFPHLAMPFRRPRSAADAMTRSLRPLPDGAPRHPALMALSAMDYGPSSSCFGAFHLTGIKGVKPMNSSVDRLFENNMHEEILKVKEELDKLKPIEDVTAYTPPSPTTPDNPECSVSSLTSGPSSEKATPPEKIPTPKQIAKSTLPDTPNFRRELLKEYQVQKQKECDDYIRQLSSKDPRAQQSVNDVSQDIHNNSYITAGPEMLAHIKPIQDQTPVHRNEDQPFPTPQIDHSGIMTAVRRETAMRQLDSMFGNMNLDNSPYTPMYTSVIEHDPRCDVHGRNSPHRSLYLYGREHSPAYRKGSISPTVILPRRRSSLSIATSPPRDMHPSTFPSSLRRDTPSPTPRLNTNRHSMGSYPNLSRSAYSPAKYSRPGSAASSIRDMKRDYVGSTNSLSRKNLSDHSKSSVDSLDSWHFSWENDHKNATNLEDSSIESPIHKTKTHAPSSGKSSNPGNGVDGRPAFKPVTELEDLQAIRCAEFHPNGKLYAVGANTKILRICAYPKIDDITEFSEPTAPSVLFKRTKHHKGSIYCLAWSPAGDLMATGSNDKTVKLMRFNSSACNLEGNEMELTMHDGTVRDICFIEDTTNKSSVLVSGGAGDCTIYVTDCSTGVPFQTLCGHSGHVLSLYNWGGAVFASGSQDKTVRIWDLRTRGCVNIITSTAGSVNKGSPVTSVAVDPSGRLLVSGHENGNCDLHDVRGTRALQRFTPHTSDIRSVRFSPGAYYLLTAGYDGNVVLTDLQGDLTCDLPRVTVAQHPSKVISARWHPDDFSFLSTSADRTAVLWTIPPV